MITKAKIAQYTTTDGRTFPSIDEAKSHELRQFCEGYVQKEGQPPVDSLAILCMNPREAIAILRMGLPRKPRTPKPKAVKAKKEKALPTI